MFRCLVVETYPAPNISRTGELGESDTLAEACGKKNGHLDHRKDFRICSHPSFVKILHTKYPFLTPTSLLELLRTFLYRWWVAENASNGHTATAARVNHMSLMPYGRELSSR